jgi:hypothetical protein
MIYAQETRSISGIIVDVNGQPVPGVSVIVKGTLQGTATDQKGFYSIEIPKSGSSLVFSLSVWKLLKRT